MNKLLVLLTAVLLTISGIATAGSDRPIWIKVKRGDTELTVAKRYGLKVSELRQLNAGNLSKRLHHHLIPGEPLNVNLGSDAKFWQMTRWNFQGGDPAGPSLVKPYEAGRTDEVVSMLKERLNKLIPQMSDIPTDVRERFTSQLEWQQPTFRFVRSTADSPLVLRGLAFGGHKSGSKLKYWAGDVMCLWQNNPHQWIAQYDPVQLPGSNVTYSLVAFLGCQNGSVIVGEVPKVEAPPDTVVIQVPPEPVVPPEPPALPPPPPEYVPPPLPPPPSVPIPSAPAAKHRDYYRDYVAWLTDEYVRIDPNGRPYDERSQNNIFLGHELSWWTNHGKRQALRLRNAEALFDMKARSGDHNLGLVFVPFSNRFLRLDLEGGLGYSAIERLYWEVRSPDPLTWEWQEKKRTTDGFGPYVRTQWILPGEVYADVKWRNHGVIEELGGYVTVRPDWFYAKLAYSDQLRPETARHFDGQTLVFPADEMIMNEGRLGASLSPRFLFYASYQHWEYESNAYWFTRFGPGGGFEWFPFRSPAWRIDGNLIRFRNLDEAVYETGDGLIRLHSHDREWRGKLGIVWAPQPK